MKKKTCGAQLLFLFFEYLMEFRRILQFADSIGEVF
jgi:hypothetical protein